MIEKVEEPQVCAWNGDPAKNEPNCTTLIVKKKTYNQKYCCKDHCRKATNKKIVEDYHKNQRRKKGQTRYCDTCKVNKLSRYNASDYCETCRKAGTLKRNSDARQLLNILS